MQTAAERDVGTFPLSIGTSLAFEGALGIHPEHPVGDKVLTDFTVCWVNVKTVFRNYYNAIGKEFIPFLEKEDLIGQFSQELEMIESVVAEQSGFKMKTVFYISDYKGLDRKYGHAVLRVDSTENQVLYTKTMKLVLGQLLKEDKDRFKVFERKIENEQGHKCLMLTSYAYDLTTKCFTILGLLESHTGQIKEKNRWYTKYYNGKELPMIPFREDFLPIFGDSEIFRPISMVYRRTLVDLAKKYNWNFTTSREKIMYGIDTLPDKFLASQLRMYLKT